MKRFLVLGLVLLTALALTVPVYADVVALSPAEMALYQAGEWLPIVLVGLVVGVTAGLLWKFWRKKK